MGVSQQFCNLLYLKLYLCKNIEDPLPGFMIRNKYKRSLVKSFKKTKTFYQRTLIRIPYQTLLLTKKKSPQVSKDKSS